MKPHSGVLVSLFELVIKYTIKVAFFYLTEVLGTEGKHSVTDL